MLINFEPDSYQQCRRTEDHILDGDGNFERWLQQYYDKAQFVSEHDLSFYAQKIIEGQVNVKGVNISETIYTGDTFLIALQNMKTALIESSKTTEWKYIFVHGYQITSMPSYNGKDDDVVIISLRSAVV